MGWNDNTACKVFVLLFFIPFVCGWVGLGLFLSKLADKRNAVHDDCYIEKSFVDATTCSCCDSGCGCTRANPFYEPFPRTQGDMIGVGTSATFRDGEKPGWPNGGALPSHAPTESPSQHGKTARRQLTQEEAWALPPPPSGSNKEEEKEAKGNQLIASTRRRLLTSRRPSKTGTGSVRGGARLGRSLKKSGKSGKDCTTHYYPCYYPMYSLNYGAETGDPTVLHGRTHRGYAVDDKTQYCYAWWAEFVAHPTGSTARCYWDRRSPNTAHMKLPNPTGWMIMMIIGFSLWMPCALFLCAKRCREKRARSKWNTERYRPGSFLVRGRLREPPRATTTTTTATITTKKPKNAAKATGGARLGESTGDPLLGASPATCAEPDCWKPAAATRYVNGKRHEADGLCVTCQMGKAARAAETPGIPEAKPVAAGDSAAAAGLVTADAMPVVTTPVTTTTTYGAAATATADAEEGSHKKWWENE